MNLTKITREAGVAYLLRTTVFGDANPGVSGAVAYYTTPGTPPGKWLGSGVAALGIRGGDNATRLQAEALFSDFAHPVTLAPLGQQPKQLHESRKQESAKQISGFDLTFTIPKSLSVLWATADRDLQRAIMAAHHEAVGHAMGWFEQQVAATRSGRGGVATAAIDGIIAIGFDHFETREGDPHLHTHVAVANRARRGSDGKWLTLNGRAIYHAAVAVSELHENTLMDLLHDRLGLAFTPRPYSVGRTSQASRAAIADVAGFPAELITRFSTRRITLLQRTRQLIAEWTTKHGAPPTRQVRDKLNHLAFHQTRRPKAAVLASLDELSARWRHELGILGYTPGQLADATLGHARSPVPVQALSASTDLTTQLAWSVLTAWRNQTPDQARTPVTPQDAERYAEDQGAGGVTARAVEHVAATLTRTRTTWTRFNARAEAERLTRLLRCRPGEREQLIDTIAARALELCVPITPHRYQLPEAAAGDPRLEYAGHTVFDDPNLRRYTSTAVLNAEAFLWSLTTPHPNDDDTDEIGDPGDADDRSESRGVDGDGSRGDGWQVPATPVITDTAADATLASWTGARLAEDQVAAARHLTCRAEGLTAVVGPAGSGKTTTMRAVHHLWTTVHGPGSVIGVAPSARAASELSDAVGIDAHTLALLLTMSTPDHIAQRAQQITTWQARVTAARWPRQRAAAARWLGHYQALDAAFTIRPGTLVIVDEASMCSTHDLAALARLTTAAGARLALVGDPAQLDAVDAGGFLGWLDRQDRTVRLTTLFRFTHPWEAAASLRIRDGDATVWYPSGDDDGVVTYADAGRVMDGDDQAMLDGAYAATRTALAEGKRAVLIAATNADVGDLNLRTTLDRRAAGLVNSSRLVPLRGEQDAGVGDQIYARRNDHRTIDSDGVGIHNGDLLTITAINDDGSAVCRRTEDGTTFRTITLTPSYLREHCELGYAVTAHRAQGITVDEANLYIPYGARMTRELLYVAMTRAQHVNRAWVGLPDAQDLAHENQPTWTLEPDGTPRLNLPTGADILARATAAQGAEITAHETRDHEIAERTNLGRLIAEHDLLASHAAAPHLTELLRTIHGDELTARITASPTFDALVSTFRHAAAVNPARAHRLLRIPLTPSDTNQFVQGALQLWDADPDFVALTDTDLGEVDPAAIAHWRLASALVNPAPPDLDDPAYIAGQVIPITTTDPALAALARQAEHLIEDRVSNLAHQLATDPPEWTRHLPGAPDPDTDPEKHHAWATAALQVAIYRDTWQVVTDASLLGPVPVGDRRQSRGYEQARDAIRFWDDPTPRWRPDLSADSPTDPHDDIDWEALDPGDATTDPHPDWTPHHPDHTPADGGAEPHPWTLTGDDITALLTPPPLPATWRDRTRPAPTPDPDVVDRITAINEAAYRFWQNCAAQPGSWVPDYLQERGAGVVAAHAPAGWTTTADHLRAHGFTDTDLITAGLVTTNSRGTLIDRFRDRLPMPLYDDGRLVGFTARANPAHADRPDVPKYLNTPATHAYDKSRTLYGLDPTTRGRLAAGATPVLVEGPFDAAAINTLEGAGVVALATCGTAVTADHLATIAATREHALTGLVAAFDQDNAGLTATARLRDLLGPTDAATTRYATWEGAKDPGELAQTGRTTQLAAALKNAAPLSVAVVRHTLATHPHDTLEQQVILTRGIADQVLQTGHPPTILAAQNELTTTLCDPDRGGHLDPAAITIAFVEALDPDLIDGTPGPRREPTPVRRTPAPGAAPGKATPGHPPTPDAPTVTGPR